jgi:hypothetical protein
MRSMHIGLAPIRLALALALAAVAGMACGELERDNPLDPDNGGSALGEELIGSWSREEVLANELYTFRRDGRVELNSFSTPGGAEVDRNAPFPSTRVRTYAGTYRLVGSQLEITFSEAISNDPGENLSVPATRKLVTITISRNTLTFDEPGGKVFYTRAL